MSAAVVLLTRDLRVHDQPALTEAAARHETVVPLFVFDETLLGDAGTPNRLSFLLDALDDVRSSLRRRGGDLIVRRGDVVEQTVLTARAAGARAVYVGDAVSAYAQTRARRLQAQLAVRMVNTTTATTTACSRPTGAAGARSRSATCSHRRSASRCLRTWKPGSCRRWASSCATHRPHESRAAARRRGVAGWSAGSPMG